VGENGSGNVVPCNATQTAPTLVNSGVNGHFGVTPGKRRKEREKERDRGGREREREGGRKVGGDELRKANNNK
jgi:hypothetical protein